MPEVAIRLARSSDTAALAALREALWPDSTAADHERDLTTLTRESLVPQTWPSAHFVAETVGQVLVGFLEVGLRSHADGCDPTQPVGFLEGWYVAESHRGRGIGRALLQAAEAWAVGQGCREMASDTWIDNRESQGVHEALGYVVVDRCVHYRKRL